VARALKSREERMVTLAIGAAMIGHNRPNPGKTGLNMAAVGFICASLLFRALVVA